MSLEVSIFNTVDGLDVKYKKMENNMDTFSCAMNSNYISLKSFLSFLTKDNTLR